MHLFFVRERELMGGRESWEWGEGYRGGLRGKEGRGEDRGGGERKGGKGKGGRRRKKFK